MKTGAVKPRSSMGVHSAGASCPARAPAGASPNSKNGANAARRSIPMRQYIALIHKEADSDYGVSFPDLPGVITAGSNLDEARGMATEALAFHLQGLAEDSEPAPEPSSLEKIMSVKENQDGVAVLIAAAAANTKAR